MWNIKKSSEAPPSSSSMMMNPYEMTKRELVNKIKFFAIYISTIVVVPNVLRAIGWMQPLGIPLTRR